MKATRKPPASLHAFATLVTGLLAGAFGYGAANVVPTFGVVPLEVRLTFHTAMMRVNEPVMQTAMALAILSTIALALTSGGTPRRLAAGAASSALATLLITVFGNIPLHAHIRRWATTTPTAGYEDILRRWETFHTLRTLTALTAFALVILATRTRRRPGAAPPPAPSRSATASSDHLTERNTQVRRLIPLLALGATALFTAPALAETTTPTAALHDPGDWEPYDEIYWEPWDHELQWYLWDEWDHFDD
ncbi:Uncharacterized membrane protein [Nonomuraea solani]|uniref:Uncharacterized membrane protein n=1 Tax=Nonomuraea solani TaxID=1144553 RepID=A0A1H6E9U8_9ACTN|nr:DUF1772 domain-containing protein [Nonomuraea solani]SEG94570.1 Uncharacterized membrane protein [Nonomuraea solani]